MTLPDSNFADRPDILNLEDTLELDSPAADPQVAHLDEVAPSIVAAGDPDALAYQAEVAGEEAVGGTAANPDQNDVDTIAAAVGIPLQPEHPVGVKRTMDRRDEHRFELDPDSQDSAADIPTELL